MKSYSIYITLLALLIIGCSQETSQKQTAKVDEHTSRTSVDWVGTYTGTLPCADCPGIETTLELSDNNQFVLEEVYKDENDEAFIEKGVFEWDETGSTITLKIEGEESTHHQYKVGENKLFRLSLDGSVVDGKLAEFYILKKK